nr:putative SAM-dependent methyltransferase [uncultured bacterium]
MNSPEHFSNAIAMRRMLYGRLLSSALYAAASLRLPDLLHKQQQTAKELAMRVKADAATLDQLLRALAAFNVVTEQPNGKFALTALGHTLRSDVPATARPTALLVGGAIGKSWDGLIDAVSAGGPAFKGMFGMEFFPYLETQPELQSTFYDSQAADLDITLEELRVVDFASYRTIVDVGGGDGALLAHVLTACPRLRGVLMDTAPVVPKARERMVAVGLADRCDVLVGNFFEAVPPGGDLYLMRDVLHDWPDERCAKLLAVCRRAMSKTAKLLIVERVSAGEAIAGQEAQLTRLMDLYMLSVLGGHERTLEQLERLLTSAGFARRACHRLSGGAAAIESVPLVG